MFRIVSSTIVFAVAVFFHDASARGCPPVDNYVPRAATGNYAVVYDRQVVMEAQVGDPEENLHDHVQHSSIAVHNETGETVLAFPSDLSPINNMYVVRYDYNGYPICGDFGTFTDDFPVRMDDPGTEGLHKHVSVAMRKAYEFYLGYDTDKKFFGSWVATPTTEGAKSRLLQFPEPKPAFPGTVFDDATFGQIAIPGGDTGDIAPSSALSGATGLGWESDFSNNLRSNDSPNQRGLLRLINSAATGELVRCCDGASSPCSLESCAVQYAVFNPCVARRDDGTQVLCYAEKEVSGAVSANFNIALRVYSPTGALVASIDRDSAEGQPKSVNEPSRDLPLSNQISHSVDIDPCGNIIIVWIGALPNSKTNPNLPCSTDDDFTVYARRLYFDDSSLVFKSRQYRVDTSGDEWKLGTDPALIHPTVALLQTHKQLDGGNGEQLNGRHLIAWNAIHRDSGQWSVRGQFFHADGRPWAREFDVSPYKTAGEDPVPDGIDRRLAESNQHTLAYIQNFYTSFATWTETNDGDHRVWLTRIDSQFYISEEADLIALSWDEVCVKGDLYSDPPTTPHNGLVDQDDIIPFIDVLLSPGLPFICEDALGLDFCRADVNGDGLVDGRDISCFVPLIVGNPPCNDSTAADCSDAGFLPPEGSDCNENEIDDSQDIRRGTSQDCNSDGIPDECQLDDNDCDADGTPDDCQLWTEDCNHNGIVDACDIAEETEADIDEDGRPDSCQVDCDANDEPDSYQIAHGADDCDGNGILDACEEDCNANGVVDACDVDPTDPDGDSIVWDDCNDNGIIDSCDLSRSILPSFDCNDNSILDECELAGNDENENGILDECEEESFWGGGESMMSSGEFDEQAAWELFFEWYDDQVFGEESDWGTLSGSQRFHRIMDEIELLGLPYAAPW